MESHSGRGESFASLDKPYSGYGLEAVLCCPACRAGGLESLAEGLRCLGCGMLFPRIGGMPILVPDAEHHCASVERMQKENPAWYAAEQDPEESSPWRHHLKKRRLYVTGVIRRHLERLGLERAERLLDLGCGDGTNLRWLSAFGRDIHGSDYNPLRLARAERRLPSAKFFLADILRYPVQPDSYDIIFCNHVIEHVPDDLGVLQTIRRILKPGGLAILGTPNEGAWWWQWAYRRAPETLRQTDHVHFYTARIIEAKMLKSGLDVTEIKHLGWGPPDWALDGRIRRYKLVDDGFALFGRVFLPHQASSLYLIATKRKPDA